MKRKVTAAEIKMAPTIPVQLPRSAHASDPISWGSEPELYGADDLKKVAIEKHARTDEFEKRLIGMWWLLDQVPVPFIFRTIDGTLRSLDAGCVGFLLNRWRPEIEVSEREGFVVDVAPIRALTERYLPIKERLMAVLRP